jgi:hypothetical protein
VEEAAAQLKQAKEEVRLPAPRKPAWRVAAVTVEMTARVKSLPLPELGRWR